MSDLQEKKVTEFVKGKTIPEVIQSIKDLANTEHHQHFGTIQDTLGVESGDNACYHCNGAEWDKYEELQTAWMCYYASREIADFIETYKEIENHEEIQQAVWEAFPCPAS